jgi:hypothetical protein
MYRLPVIVSWGSCDLSRQQDFEFEFDQWVEQCFGRPFSWGLWLFGLSRRVTGKEEQVYNSLSAVDYPLHHSFLSYIRHCFLHTHIYNSTRFSPVQKLKNVKYHFWRQLA